jgi:hypothetical protein
VALAFALVGLACSWSPLAATFALLTCLGALVLALRARRGPRPRLAALALAVALLGAAASLFTGWRATTGWSGAGTASAPLPAGAGPAPRQLDESAAATRAGRERAAGELEPPPRPKSSN